MMCCGCITSKCTGSDSHGPPWVPLSPWSPGLGSEIGGPPSPTLGSSGREADAQCSWESNGHAFHLP